MTDRINLVDAYSNRSVVAKLAKMEDEINGAQDSISTQTESFSKLADKKTEAVTTAGDTAVSKVEATRDSVVNAVTTAGTQAVADVNTASASGVKQVQDLLDGLDETVAKAEQAAATAEQASKTADEASDKAEAAAKSVDEDVIAAANAVVDAKAYATTGILHDGTTVTSADAIEKQCETIASQASGYATSASASATASANSAQEAKDAAASVDADNLVQINTNQAVTSLKTLNVADNLVQNAHWYVVGQQGVWLYPRKVYNQVEFNVNPNEEANNGASLYVEIHTPANPIRFTVRASLTGSAGNWSWTLGSVKLLECAHVPKETYGTGTHINYNLYWATGVSTSTETFNVPTPALYLALDPMKGAMCLARLSFMRVKSDDYMTLLSKVVDTGLDSMETVPDGLTKNTLTIENAIETD